jgi:hypothetical protein
MQPLPVFPPWFTTCAQPAQVLPLRLRRLHSFCMELKKSAFNSPYPSQSCAGFTISPISNPQSAIINLKFPRHSFLLSFSNKRMPYPLFSALSSSFPLPACRKKDIMPLLRASACVDQIELSRLPLLLPRPPLERTDGRTWCQPGFRSLLTSGAFLLKKRIKDKKLHTKGTRVPAAQCRQSALR